LSLYKSSTSPWTDVALRPADIGDADLAVVIDVLRATTTATQALASGYERVLCADSIERAQALRQPGRVLAGERKSVKPPGFDQGNSPLEALRRHGDELVLATTNGTPTIAAAADHARAVVLACLRNLDAVVRAVLERMAAGDLHVQLVCSGTNGAVALEDVYVAGRISQRLASRRTDAALVAEAVARGFAAPLQPLSESRDGLSLEAAGMGEDISFCSEESVLDTVPRVVAMSGSVAVVAASGEAASLSAPAPIDRLDSVSS
jgi:2-phosphosulfolactate phosphatase